MFPVAVHGSVVIWIVMSDSPSVKVMVVPALIFKIFSPYKMLREMIPKCVTNLPHGVP